MNEANPATQYFVTGGTLSATADSYIERDQDLVLFEALLDGQFGYVLNSRQMGKSSLCVRTILRLNATGVKTAFIDLTRIGGFNVTPEQWYAGLLNELGRQLGLRVQLMHYWKESSDLGPMQRFFSGLREVVLRDNKEKFAIFIDEIDATRSLSFTTDEFFAGIRECYNRRVYDSEYERLTFCLLGVAVPTDLISNPVSTPFNIGRRVYLKDFTVKEIQGFVNGVSASDLVNGWAPRDASVLVDRVHYWTHGHPFLTQSVCGAVAASAQIRTVEDVDGLIERELLNPQVRETNINFADVANRALNAGAGEPDPMHFRADLLSTYQRALSGKLVEDDESNRTTTLLKLSGLMRSEGNRLYVRNRIYSNVFDRTWIRENMPGQELRRQKKAFWLGAIRVGTVAAVIVAVFAALAISNHRLAVAAEKAKNKAEYEAYVSQIQLLRTAGEDHDRFLSEELLSATSASPFRGLEWNYWNTKIHDAYSENKIVSGFGFLAIAPDGHSLIAEDEDQHIAQTLSVPGLKPISKPFPFPMQTEMYYARRRVLRAKPPNTHTFSIFDPVTGREQSRLEEPGNNIFREGHSPDGSFIAIVWQKSPLVTPNVLDVVRSDTLKRISTIQIPDRSIDEPSLDSKGDRVALKEAPLRNGASGGYSVVTVRSTQTGRLLDEFDPPTKEFGSTVTLSPDGKLFACSTPQKLLVIRDILRRKTLFHRIMSARATGMSFSGDHRLLMLLTADGSVEVWDWQHSQLICTQDGARDAVLDLSGRYLAVCGGGTRLYDLKHLRRSTNYTSDLHSAYVVGVTKDNEICVRTPSGTDYLDSKTLLLKRLKRPSTDTNGDITQDGDYYLVHDWKKGSEVFNSLSGVSLFKLPDLKGVTRIGATPDGTTFAAIQETSPLQLTLFDRRGRQRSRTSIKGLYSSDSIACSRNGEYFACGGDSGEILIVDNEGRTIQKFTGNFTWPDWFDFDASAKHLAVGYLSGGVEIFDISGKTKPIPCFGHLSGIQSVQFNQHGDRLFTASRDGTVRLWDTSTGREVLRINLNPGRSVSAVLTKGDDAIIACDGEGHVQRIELHPNLAKGQK